jgi:hypothetical protein
LFGETRVSSGELWVGEFTIHASCKSHRLGDVIMMRLEVHPIETQDAGLIVQPDYTRWEPSAYFSLQ